MLLNLLTNAVKYNREGGQVLVEAGPSAATASCCSVSDTGRGMSDAQLQHAFEPFNRLGLESEGIEGTGIGLAIVKALVERMGGSVQARSTPEQGSVFEVRLPDGSALAAATPAPTACRHGRRAGTPTPGRPGRLLYIEDNPVNLLIVQELLAQRPDLQLHTRRRWRQRREPGPQQPARPDPGGHATARHRRPRGAAPAARRRQHRAIPCIALSANAMPEDIQRALQAGFADYWTKPLDLHAFMRKLETIFGAQDAPR